MKKRGTLELIAILSLSLILTSTTSISGAVPELLNHFSAYSRAAVEFLISIPCLSMTFMVALSPLVSKVFKERTTIVFGLLVTGLAGVLPFFIGSYPAVFASRLVLGLGLGLINVRAISIIGERYEGEKRAKILGFRLSAETIGQTILTIISGQLLLTGWSAPFLIYAAAFIILFLYLAFVPTAEKVTASADAGVDAAPKAAKMSPSKWAFVFGYSLLLGLLVATSVANGMRIPSLTVESGIGTALQANRIISLSMFAGFISGLTFGGLISKFRKALLPILACLAACGLLIVGLSGSLIPMSIGAFICGFSVNSCISCAFSAISENVPVESLNSANSMALVGCNLGASCAPMILRLIGFINTSLVTSFVVLAVVYLAIGIGVSMYAFAKRGQAAKLEQGEI